MAQSVAILGSYINTYTTEMETLTYVTSISSVYLANII